MMPCKFCKETPPARGLKQVGRTRTKGTFFVRRYRCQDCGAAMILRGNLLQEESIGETWFPPGTVVVTVRPTKRISFPSWASRLEPQRVRP
jgi:hypothetical protein